MLQIIKPINRPYLLLLLLLISLVQPLPLRAVDAERAKVIEGYRRFKDLQTNASEEEFYKHAEEYLELLRQAKDSVSYYKILTNIGFYDLDHHHFFRAIESAKRVDEAVRSDQAVGYYYLSDGLMGDIYKESHNVERADYYIRKAIEEVGDRDPKFLVLKYMDMAEMMALRSTRESIDWSDKAIKTAEQLGDAEFLSMALGLKGYVLFLTADVQGFNALYSRYTALRDQGDASFSHRYNYMMEVAHAAFNHDYERAERIAVGEELMVDRSLVLFRLYAMMGDTDKGFKVVANRFVELDSIVGAAQNSSLDEMAAEMELVKTKEEADLSKKETKRVMVILIVLTALYIFVYVMGRRRLMLKIWARNKAIKEALEKAEESDRMKTAFIQNMSHEIRTPLNAINGFSQILCTPGYDLDDDDRLDMKERITANCNNITTIVNELLELSQGESEVEKSEVSPIAVCRKVIEETEMKNLKHLAVSLDSEIAPDTTIVTNGENLRRILTQLMDNALKFTNQGSIKLCCRRLDDALEFSVVDTGCGIAEKDREQVFENFVKLDQYKGGVGLGLPVCRRLARVMGGDVTLDATHEGPGSRFVLTLPL